jgi:hypothetical protein
MGRSVSFPVRISSLLALILAIGLLLGLIIRPLFWDPHRWHMLAVHHDAEADRLERKAQSVMQADPAAADRYLRLSAWHRSRAAKYHRAAAYPGMPLPTGPESPEAPRTEDFLPGSGETIGSGGKVRGK